MRTPRYAQLLVLAALLAAQSVWRPTPARVQEPDAQAHGEHAMQPQPLPLELSIARDAPLDGEQLRAQLERELGVAVVMATAPHATESAMAALRIEAPSLRAVRIAFGASERTVDVSGSGPHAVETLALVAANLMRDEASALLASLRATAPEPPPAPAPATASAPPAPTSAATAEAERRGCAPARFEHHVFGVNLVPYVGTSSVYGARVRHTVVLNIIGGSAAALDGYALGGVFNHESYAVCGAQIAGAMNLVNGPVEGAQIGLLNLAFGRADGAQFGLVNAATGALHGAQFGLANLAARNGEALQAGFVNVAGGALEGGQAGFANVARGAVEGAQIGFVNTTAADLSGAQVGFVNTTAGDSDGAQVGFANVTSGEARGLMLGFLNVSENADAALGVLSIHTRGRTQLDAWVTDAGLMMAGVTHGGRVFHNLLGAGYTLRDGQGVFAFAYGIGARLHGTEALLVDLDAVGYGLVVAEDTPNNPDFGAILQLRVPIALRLSPAVALFVSPSLSVSAARNHANNSLEDPSLYGTRLTSPRGAASAYIWPGLSLGARFF